MKSLIYHSRIQEQLHLLQHTREYGERVQAKIAGDELQDLIHALLDSKDRLFFAESGNISGWTLVEQRILGGLCMALDVNFFDDDNQPVSNESVENLAISLTIAFIFALIPFNYIFHPLLIIFMILLNGNLLIFLFVTPILKLITPISYEELHVIGNIILSSSSLESIFNQLSTVPILIFSNWNNTVTLGGYIISLILFLSKFIVKIFRIKKLFI